jgi:hypothetical protein
MTVKGETQGQFVRIQPAFPLLMPFAKYAKDFYNAMTIGRFPESKVSGSTLELSGTFKLSKGPE